MNNRTKLTVIIISILLVSLCTVAATYSVIIEVTKNNGLTEMVNEVHVKDLLTDKDGNYNDTYYDLKDELDLTDSEANILISSKEIDNSLQNVLKNIIDYKVNENSEAKLSADELYNIIKDAVMNTEDISDETKSKIINKASIYREDVSEYIYDIEVSFLKDIV